MNNALIITTAGISSRFNRNIINKNLKSIYFEESSTNSLLSQIILKSSQFNKIIIVGGYKFKELDSFIRKNFHSLYNKKIQLVFNPHFKDYGSGYSLILGINALEDTFQSVVFVEGDLFFDEQSFIRLYSSSNSVITVSKDFILSDKSVVVYLDLNSHPKYIYDTSHHNLLIKEPFKAIFNSAQMWKFNNVRLLKHVSNSLTEDEIKSTNLEIIQKYFDLYKERYEIINVDIWRNCNTMEDYLDIFNIIKNGNNK